MTADTTATRRRNHIAYGLVIGLGALGLALAIVAAFVGKRIEWTGIVLPIVIIGNASVSYYELPLRYPRAIRIYYLVSVGVVLWIITALALPIFRR